MTDTITFTPIAELREGDRLRLVGADWRERIGRFVIVERIDLEAGRAYVSPAPDDESENGYFHAVFVNDDNYAAERVVNEEEETFDRYDPRMLPMFRAVSRIADNAGYCNEYDRIAQAIGAPTREEIRNMDQREFIVRVPVVGFAEYRIQATDAENARQKAYREVPVTELVADSNVSVDGESFDRWTAREV